MDVLDAAIVGTIERITHPATGAYARVYPSIVAEYLPVEISSRAVRYRMSRLAQRGHITRLSAYGGYVCNENARGRLLDELECKLSEARRLSLEISEIREKLAACDGAALVGM